jgi:hypothetical protein
MSQIAPTKHRKPSRLLRKTRRCFFMILILSANAYPGNINATVGRASCKTMAIAFFNGSSKGSSNTICWMSIAALADASFALAMFADKGGCGLCFELHSPCK